MLISLILGIISQCIQMATLYTLNIYNFYLSILPQRSFKKKKKETQLPDPWSKKRQVGLGWERGQSGQVRLSQVPSPWSCLARLFAWTVCRSTQSLGSRWTVDELTPKWPKLS